MAPADRFSAGRLVGGDHVPRGNGAEVAGVVRPLKNPPGGLECFAAQRRTHAPLPAAASVESSYA